MGKHFFEILKLPPLKQWCATARGRKRNTKLVTYTALVPRQRLYLPSKQNYIHTRGSVAGCQRRQKPIKVGHPYN